MPSDRFDRDKESAILGRIGSQRRDGKAKRAFIFKNYEGVK